MNPDRCLVRFEFVEAIVRCARDKFLKQDKFAKSGLTTTVSGAFEMLAKTHLQPYCEALDYNVYSLLNKIANLI